MQVSLGGRPHRSDRSQSPHVKSATRRIVAILPADQADVILLRVVADLSVDQVAQIMGKRPGTVRVLQSRALKRLAERLAKKL